MDYEKQKIVKKKKIPIFRKIWSLRLYFDFVDYHIRSNGTCHGFLFLSLIFEGGWAYQCNANKHSIYLFHELNYFIYDCIINGSNQDYECTLKIFIIPFFFSFSFYFINWKHLSNATHGYYVGRLILAITSYAQRKVLLDSKNCTRMYWGLEAIFKSWDEARNFIKFEVWDRKTIFLYHELWHLAEGFGSKIWLPCRIWSCK